MKMFISQKTTTISGKIYFVIPPEISAKEIFMVPFKKDLPKCSYPIRIATRFNQGWGVSNGPPNYGSISTPYAEIWTKDIASQQFNIDKEAKAVRK